ncbi:hypothetical protein AGLY_001239 [Aphis glycines]|uniref:Uncharacterized protein n=1 Tax=Aphis glycines TaxID=307491 RepID=A0A6G0UBQ4_APHGL|nr:hypothetical protein AGLY_001239 [Aphis glycines]
MVYGIKRRRLAWAGHFNETSSSTKQPIYRSSIGKSSSLKFTIQSSRKYSHSPAATTKLISVTRTLGIALFETEVRLEIDFHKNIQIYMLRPNINNQICNKGLNKILGYSQKKTVNNHAIFCYFDFPQNSLNNNFQSYSSAILIQYCIHLSYYDHHMNVEMNRNNEYYTYYHRSYLPPKIRAPHTETFLHNNCAHNDEEYLPENRVLYILNEFLPPQYSDGFSVHGLNIFPFSIHHHRIDYYLHYKENHN